MKYYGVEDIRIQHDLNPNSIVFEVGGWVGHFSNSIIKEFDCYVYIFEPIKDIYLNLVQKYKENPKIKIFNFGLENFNGKDKINICEEGSSLYRNNSSSFEEVEFKNINEVFDNLKIDQIDLMELNCEGSEYNILTSINEINLSKIKNLQIQFHPISNLNPENLKSQIYDKLKKTHIQKWGYDWFECWEKII
jgi:FkbM family methyltransferase